MILGFCIGHLADGICWLVSCSLKMYPLDILLLQNKIYSYHPEKDCEVNFD